MSDATPNRQFLGRELDELAGILALAVALVLLPLQLLSSQLFVVVVPPLVILASVTYLLARRRQARADFVGILPAEVGPAVAGVTFLGSGFLVAVAVASGGRSIPFFGLAAVVGTLILGQILLVRDEGLHPGLVVAEILVFALAVRVAALVTTPGLVGVDSWTHLTDYAASIQASGSLAAISDVKYYSAPLYHVLVVLFADAVGTSLRTALYLSLGLTLPLVGLFVYGTARHVLPVRWALFALAVYTVGDHVVRWGIHIIPTSLGLLFFLALLYCVTRLFYTETRWPMYAIVLLLSLAIVLTHQVSAFILVVVLGAGALGQVLARYVPIETTGNWFDGHARPVNLAGLFVFEMLLVVATWSRTPYGDRSFLVRVSENLYRALVTDFGFLNLASESGGATTAGTPIPTTIAAIDDFGFFVLLFLTLVGILALLHRQARGRPALAYVAAILTLLVVTMGLPLLGIRTLIPGRWYGFMYAPMVIVAAAGCLFVARRFPRTVTVAAFVLIAALLPGALLISHKGTPDQPVFDDHYQRFAYSESELAAVDTVAERSTEQTIYTDHPYRTVFERSGASTAEVMSIEDGSVEGSPVVYRRYQSTGAPIVESGNVTFTKQLSVGEVCSADSNRLYANSEVLICTDGS